MMQPRLAILLLVFGLLVGCDAIESLVDPAPTDRRDAPRPAEIKFEVDDDLYYVTRRDNGKFYAVRSLDKIPVEHRGTVYIYPPGFLPDFDGRDTRHVANLLGAQPGEEHVARLRGGEFIGASEAAGRAAGGASRLVHRRAMGVAGARSEPERADRARTDEESSARKEHDRPGERGGIEIEVVGSRGATHTQPGDSAARNLPDVTVFYADWCKPCHTAMDWMDDNHVPYRAVDIEASDANRREMVEFCREKGRSPRSVPTIRIGDEIMTGWDAGRFARLAGI